jgi:DNA-directed RNA polymerase alpha subunit
MKTVLEQEMHFYQNIATHFQLEGNNRLAQHNQELSDYCQKLLNQPKPREVVLKELLRDDLHVEYKCLLEFVLEMDSHNMDYNTTWEDIEEFIKKEEERLKENPIDASALARLNYYKDLLNR